MKVGEIQSTCAAGRGESATKAKQVERSRYAVSVQGAVGPKVLDGSGLKARVSVTYSLSADGGLVAARVTQSSGYTSLDAKVMDLIRQARFPTAPEGMSGPTLIHTSVITFA